MKIILAVALFVLFEGFAQAQWLVEDLYPASGTGISQAVGVFANEQCGFVDSNASIWHGTAASWSSPSSGFMTATDGTQQVGWSLQIGGGVFAARWVNGTLSFLTNLSGAQGSGLYALFGKTYGGYNDFNGKWQAVYWPKINRPVSLHPPGMDSSLVEAVSKSMQAGRICPVSQSECFAATWRGRASSVANLHPAGFVDSNIRGMQGNTAVGWATDTIGRMHAIFWDLANGTYTDASGGLASGINGVSNNWGAGAITPSSGSGPHAYVWDLQNGSNNTDLHAFLPAGLYSDSAAFGIWRNTAGSTYVVGMATSTSDLQQHAMLWYTP